MINFIRKNNTMMQWPAWLLKTVTLTTCLTFVWPLLGWAFNSQTYPVPAHTLPVFGDLKKPLTLLPKLGTIKSHHAGQTQTVILIEDLHCHAEVQHNIAGIIDKLVKQEEVNLIGLEGASGSIELGVLKDFPIQSIRTLAADYFLRQGKVTGAEYFAAQTSRPVNLIGIENPDTYQAAYDLANSFLTSESQGLYHDLADQLAGLKDRLYNNALKQFDQAGTAYRSGERTMLRYAFHLKKWARKTGIDWSGYPTLARLLQLSGKQRMAGIDIQDVNQECDRLEQAIRNKLYTNSDQQQLDRLFQRLRLIEHLLSISITPEQWQSMQANPDTYQIKPFIDFISRFDQLDPFWTSELVRLDDYLQQARRFYQLADQRSDEFVANLRKSMIRQNESLAVMISGGFHKERILDKLKADNMSFAVIRPAMTKTDLINPYFSIIQGQLLPLEELLLNNQTNLAAPIWSQANPTSYAATTGMMVESLALGLWDNLKQAEKASIAWVQATWQTVTNSTWPRGIKAFVHQSGQRVLAIPSRWRLPETMKTTVTALVDGIQLMFVKQDIDPDKVVAAIAADNPAKQPFNFEERAANLAGWAYLGLFLAAIGYGLINGQSLDWAAATEVLNWLAALAIGMIGMTNSAVENDTSLPYVVNFKPAMDLGLTNKIEDFLKDAGGKGRGLIRMCALGLPIPPGFVLRAKASLEIIANHGHLQDDHLQAITQGMAQLEQDSGKTFGDKENPLLVSVRSGANTSMPGMMETVFYVGLTKENLPGFARQMNNNQDYAYKTYAKAVEQFAVTVFGIDPKEFDAIRQEYHDSYTSSFPRRPSNDWEYFQGLAEEYKETISAHQLDYPDNASEQLRLATERVANSWNDDQVRTYRERERILNTGTGISIQQMVFGNKNNRSGAGVVYSRDFKTGKKKLSGNWLRAKTGQTIVAGLIPPDDIEQLKKDISLQVYQQLQQVVEQLEQEFKLVVDVEFTVEDGQLYILQVRSAEKKLYPRAKIIALRQMINSKLIGMQDLFQHITLAQLQWMVRFLRAPHFSADTNLTPIAQGIGAAVGIKSGRLVFTAAQAQTCQENGEPFILAVEVSQKDHDKIIHMTNCVAVLEMQGAALSHASALMREMLELKPVITGLSKESNYSFRSGQEFIEFQSEDTKIRHGEWLTVDGSTGHVYPGDVSDQTVDSIVSRHLDNPSAYSAQRHPDIGLYKTVLKWIEAYQRKIDEERASLDKNILAWMANPDQVFSLNELEGPLNFIREHFPQVRAENKFGIVRAVASLWLVKHQLPVFDFSKENPVDQDKLEWTNAWMAEYMFSLNNDDIIQFLEIVYQLEPKAFYQMLSFPGKDQGHVRLIGFDMEKKDLEGSKILLTLFERHPEMLVNSIKNIPNNIADMNIMAFFMYWVPSISFILSRWTSLLPNDEVRDVAKALDAQSVALLVHEWLISLDKFDHFYRGWQLRDIGEMVNQTLDFWKENDSKKVEQFWEKVSDIDTKIYTIAQVNEIAKLEFFSHWEKTENIDDVVQQQFTEYLKVAGVQKAQVDLPDDGRANITPLKQFFKQQLGWQAQDYERQAWWIESTIPTLLGSTVLVLLIMQFTGLWQVPLLLSSALLAALAAYWPGFRYLHTLDQSWKKFTDDHAEHETLMQNYQTAQRLTRQNLSLLTAAVVAGIAAVLLAAWLGDLPSTASSFSLTALMVVAFGSVAANVSHWWINQADTIETRPAPVINFRKLQRRMQEATRIFENGLQLENEGDLERADEKMVVASISYQSAAAAFNDALELNPELVEAWIALGRVQLKRGEVAKAGEALERARELDAENIEDNNLLNQSYQSNQPFPEFVEPQQHEWEKTHHSLFPHVITYSHLARHPEQMIRFKDQVLPSIVQQKMNKNERQIKIISYGVSTGEEAVTLAAMIRASFATHPQWGSIDAWSIKIIGLDRDQESVIEANNRLAGNSSLLTRPQSWREVVKDDYNRLIQLIKPVLKHNAQWLREAISFQTGDITNIINFESMAHDADAVVANLVFNEWDEPDNMVDLAAAYSSHAAKAYLIGAKSADGYHPFEMIDDRRNPVDTWYQASKPGRTLSYFMLAPDWANPTNDQPDDQDGGIRIFSEVEGTASEPGAAVLSEHAMGRAIMQHPVLFNVSANKDWLRVSRQLRVTTGWWFNYNPDTMILTLPSIFAGTLKPRPDSMPASWWSEGQSNTAGYFLNRYLDRLTLRYQAALQAELLPTSRLVMLGAGITLLSQSLVGQVLIGSQPQVMLVMTGLALLAAALHRLPGAWRQHQSRLIINRLAAQLPQLSEQGQQALLKQSLAELNLLHGGDLIVIGRLGSQQLVIREELLQSVVGRRLIRLGEQLPTIVLDNQLDLRPAPGRLLRGLHSSA